MVEYTDEIMTGIAKKQIIKEYTEMYRRANMIEMLFEYGLMYQPLLDELNQLYNDAALYDAILNGSTD